MGHRRKWVPCTLPSSAGPARVRICVRVLERAEFERFLQRHRNEVPSGETLYAILDDWLFFKGNDYRKLLFGLQNLQRVCDLMPGWAEQMMRLALLVNIEEHCGPQRSSFALSQAFKNAGGPSRADA
jgi:hypothetical protein